MSNRLPLLDILHNEFQDYQIFLSTYDRTWFEVAKHVLPPSDWQTVEMYSAEQGMKGTPGYCDRPVIITPSDDHYTKAQKYYDTKDYPASANYLRKELEKQIKNRLPAEQGRSFDGKFKPLQTLWHGLIHYHEAFSRPLPETLKVSFDRSKRFIFNPMSHDSLSQPVYRAELNMAFEVVDTVRTLPILRRVLLLSKGAQLVYESTVQSYAITVELLDDWYITLDELEKPPDTVRTRVLDWTQHGIPFYSDRTGQALSQSEIDIIQSRRDYKLSKVFAGAAKSAGLPSIEGMLEHTRVAAFTIAQLLTDAHKELIRPSANFLFE